MSAVTLNALAKHINRKLAHEGERLCTAQSESWCGGLGWHYIVDYRNSVVAGHLDPEKLGRELGVLRASERAAS